MQKDACGKEDRAVIFCLAVDSVFDTPSRLQDSLALSVSGILLFLQPSQSLMVYPTYFTFASFYKEILRSKRTANPYIKE